MTALAKFEKSTSTPLPSQDLRETTYGGFPLRFMDEPNFIDLKSKHSGTFDIVFVTHPDNDHIYSLGSMLSRPDGRRLGGIVEATSRAFPSCVVTQTDPLGSQQFLATTMRNSSANQSQICAYTLLTPGGAATSSLLAAYADSYLPNPTLSALAEYESLSQPNWDGFDAEPITRATLDYARQLIGVMPRTFGPPDMSPSGDGSIALEWIPEAGPIHKLFLDIGPGEQWRAYWKRRNGEFGRLPGGAISADTRHLLEKLFADLSE